jgi:hypothetical protein
MAPPLLSLLLLFLLLLSPTTAIKFVLQSYRYAPAKCIWNTAHTNALVIVTANISPGPLKESRGDQRVDVEIIDSSPEKRVYLSKRDIQGETRLAITTHAEGELGVCFRNWMSTCELASADEKRA